MLLKNSFLVFKKDLSSELRTRYVINSLLMFVLVTISIIKFALGDEKVDNEILTGLLWIAIFFTSVSGLSRTFVKEEEKETSTALKLSTGTDSVIIGKLFFNLILTFALNLLILILFIFSCNCVRKSGSCISIYNYSSDNFQSKFKGHFISRTVFSNFVAAIDHCYKCN